MAKKKSSRKSVANKSTNRISKLRDRLREVRRWGPKEIAALRNLHKEARSERAERRNLKSKSLGPYERLELRLFGDPRKLMSTHEEQGLGFAASLMDGPLVDPFTLAGIKNCDELEEAVWEETNWKDLLEDHTGVHLVVIGEDESPRVSDVSYWVWVSDPLELARELREAILQHS